MPLNKKSPENVWRILLRLGSKHMYYMVITLAGFFGWWVVDPYIIPKIVGKIIVLLQFSNDSTLLVNILPLFLQYLLFWMLCNCAMMIGGIFYSKFIPKSIVELKANMFNALQKRTYDFFIKFNEGVLAKSIDILGTNIGNTLDLFFVRFIPGSIVFAVIFINFMLLNWLIGVTLAAWVVIHFWISVHFFKKISTLSAVETEIHSQINAFLVDSFKNQKIKEIFNLKNSAEKLLSKLQNQDSENSQKIIHLKYWVKFVKGAACLLFQGVLINSILFHLWSSHVINLGELIALINVNGGVIHIIWHLSEKLPDLFQFLTRCESVLHFLDVEPANFRKFHSLKIIKPAGGIYIKNITFAYEKEVLLKKFSMKIPPKSKVLIMGYSGIGKSTFINIISGLIQKYKGEVFFDNINIKSLDRDFFKSYMSFITSFGLFSGSVGYNIALEEEFDEKKMKKIMERTLIPHINFSHKIETASSCQFSDGEKQRMLIARGLWNENCHILIGDEPFKGLDFHNKEKVKKEILSFSKNKTLIIVDHGLTLAKDVDYIVFFGKDQKIHVGSFKALTKKNKEFADFIQSGF